MQNDQEIEGSVSKIENKVRIQVNEPEKKQAIVLEATLYSENHPSATPPYAFVQLAFEEKGQPVSYGFFQLDTLESLSDALEAVRTAASDENNVVTQYHLIGVNSYKLQRKPLSADFKEEALEIRTPPAEKGTGAMISYLNPQHGESCTVFLNAAQAKTFADCVRKTADAWERIVPPPFNGTV